MSEMSALTVTELTRCIRGVIEAEDLFRDLWVRGEISNLTKHSSGHIYFSLKDEESLIRCVLWSSEAKSVRFELADGMRVLVHGRVSVYEKQGQYQLVLSELMPDGVGDLHLAFEQLKARLQAEGLFDERHKKPMPAYPRKIAVITSSTAAALRDMISIARRRMPSINIVLIPTLMQGADSAAKVADALKTADDMPGIDVIVLGRGGGSIEDLWTFNSEAVVRAVHACRTPVVSAIGHETDYTLSDFAADLRAPTPSAAMELIVPEQNEVMGRIRGLLDAVCSCAETCLAGRRTRLDLLMNSPGLKYPERMLHSRWQTVDLLDGRLRSSFQTVVSQSENRLGEVSARLESLSPLGVLARGYAIVKRTKDGNIVRRASEVSTGDQTETWISDGRLISEVTDIKEGWT
jgi:exodeoxyribonuclease VII large subunit